MPPSTTPFARTGAPSAVRLAAAYVVALVVPALIGVALSSSSESPPLFPGAWMLVAVVVATLLGGSGPAAVGIVASLVSLWFAVLEPRGSFAVPTGRAVLGLVGFAVAGALVVLVVEQLNRAVTANLRATEAEAAAEGRAAASAAVLDALLQGSPVGFAFIDPTLRFVLVNEQLAAFNGLPVAEHLGRPVAEVVPDLAEQNVRLFRHVLQTGEPLLDMELEGATPGTGEHRRVWLVNYFPVRVEGTVIGVGATVVDVTDRRLLEQLRRESEAARATAELAQQLEEAQRIAHVGSWSWFPADDRMSWSTELHRMFALDPLVPVRHAEDLISRVPGTVAAAVNELAGRIRSADGPFEIEVEVPIDGDLRLFTLRGEPFRDSTGQDGYRGTAEDITEARRAQVALTKAREDLLVADIERRRVRATVESLQHAVLPERLPVVAGYRLDAGYDAAGGDVDFGGDWYDAFEVAGDLVLVVGDVAGHGLAAASEMAELRNALRAFAHEDARPACALERLNRLMCALGGDRLGTAVIARCSPDGTITWSRAGHPPPVRFGDGTATLVGTEAGGLLLGADPGSHYPEGTIALTDGQALLLYTDGVIERRDRGLDEGLRALVATFSGVVDLDDVAGAVEHIAADHEDDVCYLAVARAGPNS